MNRSLIIAMIIVWVVLAITMMGFVLDKCGPKGILLGNQAPTAIALGMCD